MTINASFRKSHELFNFFTMRCKTEDETSLCTMARDAIEEGSCLIAVKEAWTAQILEQHGFDPSTGLYPGELPAMYRNHRPREVTICPWEILGFSEEEWDELCLKQEVREEPSGVEGKRYSAPDKETYKLQEKRRTSRPEVAPENVETQCKEYLKRVNRLQGDSRHWIRHSWTMEIDAEEVVYIAVDAVLVPEQAEHRVKGGKEYLKKHTKNVSHWNARLEARVNGVDMVYNFTSQSIDEVFKELVAFILYTKLYHRYFIFFTDGEDCIFTKINEYFAQWEHTIYLDWYHVVKKIYDRTSMFIKGKRVVDPHGEKEYYKKTSKAGQLKSAEMTSLSRLFARELVMELWFGNWREAIEYIKNIPPTALKPGAQAKEHQDKLVAYFERKGQYITCPGLRKKAGLRNASNGSENLNQIDVADRQKNKGMSWRKKGSTAICSLACMHENEEDDTWFHEGKFRPALKRVKNKGTSDCIQEHHNDDVHQIDWAGMGEG